MRIGYLKRHVCTRKGVYSLGKGEYKTTVWSICNSRQFCVSRYSILNWWHLYMLTVFLLCICVHGIAWFFSFSILLMFVIISLMAYANISFVIINLFWLRFCWWMSCCKLMIDIIAYVIYVPVVWYC